MTAIENLFMPMKSFIQRLLCSSLMFYALMGHAMTPEEEAAFAGLVPEVAFEFEVDVDANEIIVLKLRVHDHMSLHIIDWDADGAGDRELWEGTSSLVHGKEHEYTQGGRFRVKVYSCPENIEELHLGEQDLVGVLDISKLSHLVRLDVNNSLSGNPTDDFNNLEEIIFPSTSNIYMKQMNLNRNVELSGTLDLSVFPNLEVIYTRYCKWDALVLGNQPGLKTLAANHNDIDGVVDFTQSNGLVSVELQNNQIKHVAVTETDNAYPDLLALFLNSNVDPVTGDRLQMHTTTNGGPHQTNEFPLYAMPKIKSFNIAEGIIDYVHFTDGVVTHNYNTLEMFSTSNCGIQNPVLDLTFMTVLKTFSITNCQVQKLLIPVGTSFPLMVHFDVSDNPGLIIIDAINNTTGVLLSLNTSNDLKVVNLNDTNIPDIIIPPNTTQLVDFIINETPITSGSFDLSGNVNIKRIWLSGPLFTLSGNSSNTSQNYHSALVEVKLNDTYDADDLATLLDEVTHTRPTSGGTFDYLGVVPVSSPALTQARIDLDATLWTVAP